MTDRQSDRDGDDRGAGDRDTDDYRTTDRRADDRRIDAADRRGHAGSAERPADAAGPAPELPDEPLASASFDPGSDSPTEELLGAIASLDDAAADDLAVLAEFVDPDALDALFRPRPDGSPRESERSVQFAYDEYVVRVRNGGEISIHRPEAGTDD